MTYKKIHIKYIYAIISIALLYLFCLTCPSQAQKLEQNDYFYVLNAKQGLADNHILQMIQLPGGKMAVETFKGINIYDGKRFHFIAISSADAQPIRKYEGQIHLSMQIMTTSSGLRIHTNYSVLISKKCNSSRILYLRM